MQERKLMELAEAAGNIAIVGHVRPDGDCVGSVSYTHLNLTV